MLIRLLLLSVGTSLLSTAATYSYDGSGRLAKITYSASAVVYTYDAAGNLITRQVQSVTQEPPFGSFDIPTNGQTGLAGTVNVGGRAFSGAPVTVQLWRNPVPHEATAANGLVYIQNTNFVAGSRPDVPAAYPGSLNSNDAGWGTQLLTNELPNSAGTGPSGNGTYTLHALATDSNGLTTDLGAHTITVNNATSVLPFGTIDTPADGATISGTVYVNFGWALTPEPSSIPTNGSTIWVFVDNFPLGHPVYNNPRSDIQALFPGYANTNGAVGYFYIDTTTLSNGLHTISWSVADDAGHKTGIGSRYFTVQN
jgi:YD repeat-containing protein